MEEIINSKKTKVMIVDDDAAVSNFLQRFLSKKSYQVVVANNGPEAIKLTKEESPQLVLLDIRMPEMNGIEVLQEIKKVNPGIGVIMITAVQEEEIAREAMKLGADDYICKPFDLQYLENSLLAKIALMTE